MQQYPVLASDEVGADIGEICLTGAKEQMYMLLIARMFIHLHSLKKFTIHTSVQIFKVVKADC